MLEFMTTNLPVILCLLVGIGLLIAEVFMPGFGVAGISGICLEIASIVLTYLNHGALAALGMTIVCLAVIGITISVAIRSASNGKLSKSSIILNERETVAEGYSATTDMEVFLGREGVTTTVLRPTGMAEFDGVKLNVIADGEYIQQAEAVRIEKVEGARIVVRKLAKKSKKVSG